MGRFNFTGKVRIQPQDSKYPAYRSGKSKGGNKYSSFNFFVNAADNNSANVELFGMVQDEIKSATDEGEVTIPWEDRKDKKQVDAVVNYRKNVISLGDKDDRESFIAPYDAVEFLNDNVDELKGKRVTVTGRVVKSEYNGKISDRFQIQNVYAASEERKNSLTIISEIFFAKDGFDFSDFKDEKRIYLTAYTREYIDKEHQNVYVPCTLVIDASKVDFEGNEEHVKMFNVRYMPINLKYEKGKVSVDLKGNKYYSIMAEIRYFNGAEASSEEFSEKDLTPLQRKQLEAGIKSLDDFRASGTAYGNRVTLYKLVNFDTRGAYDNGCVVVDETVDEFNDNIYQIASSEDVDDGFMNEPEEAESEEKVDKKGKAKAKKEEEKKKAEEDEDEDDNLDDLFD